MKIQCASLIAALVAAAVPGSSAFMPAGPRAFVGTSNNVALFMAEEKTPFFASETTAAAAADASTSKKEQSLEEEVEELTKAEIQKMQKASNLRNANGVDYAPWMNISADDEKKIKQVMKERTQARRLRQEQERTVSGNLLVDSQAQELSGGGLRTKVIGTDVSISWATNKEGNTKGFIIKRRPAKTDDEAFQVLVSFQDWGPLATKGTQGGEYSYLDTTTSPGGYVYRVTEEENSGKQNDICQALVEVQTEDEQRGAVIAAVSIAAVGVAVVAAGILLDPVGGF
jgi:hypothetical protein